MRRAEKRPELILRDAFFYTFLIGGGAGGFFCTY